MNHQETLTSYIAAFVAELVKSGVEDVVVSPGSRSTPMAMVMAEHPELRVHIHVDERSAAFLRWELLKHPKNRQLCCVHPEQLQPITTLPLWKPGIPGCR